MIEIQEEIILKEISDLLMNELPKYLLELEEQSGDGASLLPLRYAGPEGAMPVGTGAPYAFIRIEEGKCTEKDRIIKNVVYTVYIQWKILEYRLIWRYYTAFLICIDAFSLGNCEITEKKTTGDLCLQIKR